MEAIGQKDIKYIKESDLKISEEEFRLKIDNLLVKTNNNTSTLSIQRKQIIKDIKNFRGNAIGSCSDIVLKTINTLLKDYNEHAMRYI